MNHECVPGSGRKREMMLRYICSCGEEFPSKIDDLSREDWLFIASLICRKKLEVNSEFNLKRFEINRIDRQEAQKEMVKLEKLENLIIGISKEFLNE